MKIVLETVLIIMCSVITVCALRYVIAFEKKSKHVSELFTICTHHEGSMTYIMAQSETGEITMRNYTLDSLEFVSQKKFLELDGDR